MNELSKAEEFARIAFTAHYEAAHGEGGQLAWARLGDGERQLWLEAGEAIDRHVSDGHYEPGSVDLPLGERDVTELQVVPAPELAAVAADRDRLAELVRRFERIATAWTRGMYCARIDCMRGDVKAAVECLSEGLDGYDGTGWDGTETGAEWWERTKAEEGL